VVLPWRMFQAPGSSGLRSQQVCVPGRWRLEVLRRCGPGTQGEGPWSFTAGGMYLGWGGGSLRGSQRGTRPSMHSPKVLCRVGVGAIGVPAARTPAGA
jgi:hypothetical protein